MIGKNITWKKLDFAGLQLRFNFSFPGSQAPIAAVLLHWCTTITRLSSGWHIVRQGEKKWFHLHPGQQLQTQHCGQGGLSWRKKRGANTSFFLSMSLLPTQHSPFRCVLACVRVCTHTYSHLDTHTHTHTFPYGCRVTLSFKVIVPHWGWGVESGALREGGCGQKKVEKLPVWPLTQCGNPLQQCLWGPVNEA